LIFFAAGVALSKLPGDFLLAYLLVLGLFPTEDVDGVVNAPAWAASSAAAVGISDSWTGEGTVSPVSVKISFCKN